VSLGDLDIKEVILKIFYVLEVILEDIPQFNEIVGYLWAFAASKDWHANVVTLTSKLKLTLTDLFKILTPLDEGLVLSKDGAVCVQSRVLSRTVLLNETLNLETDSFPLLAAGN
jgi:hypothetical protein